MEKISHLVRETMSLRLDVGSVDDLAPLLALGFDMRPERRGREHQRRDAELTKLCPD